MASLVALLICLFSLVQTANHEWIGFGMVIFKAEGGGVSHLKHIPIGDSAIPIKADFLVHSLQDVSGINRDGHRSLFSRLDRVSIACGIEDHVLFTSEREITGQLIEKRKPGPRSAENNLTGGGLSGILNSNAKGVRSNRSFGSVDCLAVLANESDRLDGNVSPQLVMDSGNGLPSVSRVDNKYNKPNQGEPEHTWILGIGELALSLLVMAIGWRGFWTSRGVLDWEEARQLLFSSILLGIGIPLLIDGLAHFDSMLQSM